MTNQTTPGQPHYSGHRPANPGGDVFAPTLLKAFADSRIEAAHRPPAGVSVTLPDGDTASLDLGEAFSHARSVPADELRDFAEGIVRGVMRSFRRRGVRLGTHYPLPADDEAGHALLAAFTQAGYQARFVDPARVGFSTQDGRQVESSAELYRATAQHASGDEYARLAAEFVTAFERDSRRAEEQGSASADEVSDRLRLRLYPESMLTSELRASVVTREFAPGLWETVAVDHPDSVQPLNRSAAQSEADIDRAFDRALGNSLDEEFEVSEREVQGVRILHIGGAHRYMAAHAHVLERRLDPVPAENGALVSFPVPEVVLVHPFGSAHPFAGLEIMQDITDRFTEGERPISSQLYWWRPGGGDGFRLDLRPVRVEVDHEAKSISLAADDDFRRVVDRLLAQE